MSGNGCDICGVLLVCALWPTHVHCLRILTKHNPCASELFFYLCEQACLLKVSVIFCRRGWSHSPSNVKSSSLASLPFKTGQTFACLIKVGVWKASTDIKQNWKRIKTSGQNGKLVMACSVIRTAMLCYSVSLQSIQHNPRIDRHTHAHARARTC